MLPSAVHHSDNYYVLVLKEVKISHSKNVSCFFTLCSICFGIRQQYLKVQHCKYTRPVLKSVRP